MAVSEARTSAGTTISIGSAAPASYTQVAYEALTYTLISEVTDIGEFGREYTLVTHNPIGDRGTVKRKGSFNDGALALQMARVPDNAGQAAVIAARDVDVSHGWKIVYPDGTIGYFAAQTMSYTTNVGNVDQIWAASVNVEIDSGSYIEV
jgi:hypothetical protein